LNAFLVIITLYIPFYAIDMNSFDVILAAKTLAHKGLIEFSLTCFVFYVLGPGAEL
jgi:hypothetical protein